MYQGKHRRINAPVYIIYVVWQTCKMVVPSSTANPGCAFAQSCWPNEEVFSYCVHNDAHAEFPTLKTSLNVTPTITTDWSFVKIKQSSTNGLLDKCLYV